jgi:O-antigen ligase
MQPIFLSSDRGRLFTSALDRRATSPGASRTWNDLRLIVPALALAGVLVAGSVMLAGSLAWAPLLPLGLVAVGLAAWLVLAAACGSPAAIMLYLGILVFLINAQFRVRGAGDIQGDWQSALKFLVWLGAGVIGAPHLPPLRRLVSHPGAALWLAYIAVALISSLYSPAAGYSFGCSLALMCLFAFAFAITRRLAPAQMMWTITIALAVFNIGGWFVFFAEPELGVSAAWTTSGLMMRMCGLAGQATNLGAVCAIAFGLVFVLWREKACSTPAAIVFGGFAFATLVKSDARTTEIATLAGVGLVLAAQSARRVMAGSLAAIAALILLQIYPKLPGLLGAQFSRSGDPTEVYTLTGRLEIWDFAWQQIRLSPIFGYGYNSSKVVLGSHIGFENGLMVDSAHNMYLQNLLSVGALGTLPLIGLLGFLSFKCFTRPTPIVLYVLVDVLISSISDTDAIGTTPTLVTLLLFAVSIWPDRSPAAEPRSSRPRAHAISAAA